MKSTEILVKIGALRKKQPDKEKIKSIIKFSEINANVAKQIPLNENSATLIFREIYESIRQLGDAKWWQEGYEPNNHEISLDILKEIEIADKIKLNNLDRYKRIRHDANYKGFRVTTAQAQEILEFWENCCKEIIRKITETI